MKKIVALAIVSVIILTASVSLAAETKGMTRVRIATQRGMFAALAFVVKEKDFLKEEGIDGEWNWFAATPQLLEAMKGGSIDIGLPAGSVPSQVGRGNGLPIHFVANIAWGNEVIILRKDLTEKVDVKKPQTLKNLVIATIAKGSMQDYIARLWLEQMGLNSDTDVQFREVAAGAAQRSALLSKSIDIASTLEPYGTLLANEGLGVIVGLGEQILPHHDNCGLVVTKSFLQNNRVGVQGILKALDKALKFAKGNPQEFYQIVAKYFQVDPAVVKSSFEKRIIVLPDSLAPNDDFYYKVGTWLDKWGYTQQKPSEYLPDFLGVWKSLQQEAGVYKK